MLVQLGTPSEVGLGQEDCMRRMLCMTEKKQAAIVIYRVLH